MKSISRYESGKKAILQRRRGLTCCNNSLGRILHKAYNPGARGLDLPTLAIALPPPSYRLIFLSTGISLNADG